MYGKPGSRYACVTNRCFTPSKLPAGADFRSITKLIGNTSLQFAKIITAVLGEAGNYQARGCPPTRLAAADSISFKSACVRAPAASIFRINSSNRAARKCISRRSEPVSSPSVFTSMRHSLVHRALSTRPLTSVRRACCRRGVINPGEPFRCRRIYVTQNVRQKYLGQERI